jgi:hypothetical protein
MTLDDIPAGTWVLVDANILIYAKKGRIPIGVAIRCDVAGPFHRSGDLNSTKSR